MKGWKKIKNTMTDVVYEEKNKRKADESSFFEVEAHKMVGAGWSVTIPPMSGEERFFEVETKKDALYIMQKFMKKYPRI